MWLFLFVVNNSLRGTFKNAFNLKTGIFKGIKMNERIKRVWTFTNIGFLAFFLFIARIYPKNMFVIDQAGGVLKICILFMIVSITVFLFLSFIASFISIQRAKLCNLRNLGTLLLNLFSLLFLMIAKVMADDIAHEWIPGSNKPIQLGEFWIFTICLLFIIFFMLTPFIWKVKR